MLSRYLVKPRLHPCSVKTITTKTQNLSTMSDPSKSTSDMEDFRSYLKSSNRILSLLGAGLSAASGLPTFRGAGGLWRDYAATDLATPDAFDDDPALVWRFYSYRRHMALKANPNKAHYALAELAKKNKNFITLSQNVDGELLQSVNDVRMLKFQQA